MRDIVESALPQGLCAVLCGDNCESDVNERVLEYKFDYIFFTGGAEVGQKVYTAAAKTLTPVTLELGGKSPVIVDETAKIDLAARRIVFGKLLNAGQASVLRHRQLPRQGELRRFFSLQVGIEKIKCYRLVRSLRALHKNKRQVCQVFYEVVFISAARKRRLIFAEKQLTRI